MVNSLLFCDIICIIIMTDYMLVKKNIKAIIKKFSILWNVITDFSNALEKEKLGIEKKTTDDHTDTTAK